MLLKQIQYFIAVVEYNSFTEASMQCYVSQSAISQQIKLLEEELDVELLKREGRSFSLTEAGEYFYRHSKAILDEIESVKLETKRRGQNKELSLKIGYPKNFSFYEIQSAISQFCDIYPEVSISIVSGTHEELYQLLRERKIDLKISEQRRAYNDDYYNYELKHSDSFVEISTLNSLSKKEILSVEELKHLSCIIVVSKGYEESEKNFYENDLMISRQFLYADSLEQARLMVTGNRGFLPIDVIGKVDNPVRGIKRVPMQRNGKPVQRNYFACWNKENTNYYIEEFVELLRNLFQ